MITGSMCFTKSALKKQTKEEKQQSRLISAKFKFKVKYSKRFRGTNKIWGLKKYHMPDERTQTPWYSREARKSEKSRQRFRSNCRVLVPCCILTPPS